jgi:hypothetical protein
MTDDQLGARMYPNGVVEVFRNQQLVGSRSVADWPVGHERRADRLAFRERLLEPHRGLWRWRTPAPLGDRPPLADRGARRDHVVRAG